MRCMRLVEDAELIEDRSRGSWKCRGWMPGKSKVGAHERVMGNYEQEEKLQTD